MCKAICPCVHFSSVKRSTLTFFLGALTLGGVVLVLRASPTVTGNLREAKRVGLQLEGGAEQTIDADQVIEGDIVLKDDAVLTVRSTVRLRTLPGESTVRVTVMDRAKLFIENGAIVPADDPRSMDAVVRDDAALTLREAFLPVTVALRGKAVLTANDSAISTIIGPTKIDPSQGAYGAIDLADAARAELISSVVGGVTLRFAEGDVVDIADLWPQKYADYSVRTAAKSFSPAMDLILRRSTILGDTAPGQNDAGWSMVVDPKARVRVRTSYLQRITIGPLVADKTVFQDLPLLKKLSMKFRGLSLEDTTINEEWGFWGADSSPIFRRSEGLWLQPSGIGTWTVERGGVSRIDAKDFNGDLLLKGVTWTDGGSFSHSGINLRGDIEVEPRVTKRLSFDDSVVRREFRFVGPSATSQVEAQVLDGATVVVGLMNITKNLLLPVTFDESSFSRALTAQLSIDGKTFRKDIRFGSTSPIAIGK